MKGSTEKVFRYLGDNFFENYPKWSPEVKELKQIGEQPMGPGVTARQVREGRKGLVKLIFTFE